MKGHDFAKAMTKKLPLLVGSEAQATVWGKQCLISTLGWPCFHLLGFLYLGPGPQMLPGQVSRVFQAWLHNAHLGISGPLQALRFSVSTGPWVSP